MKPASVAVVGAAETTEMGVVPGMSEIQLHADAALNAMRDAGLKPSDIDGFATANHQPQSLAHYLGITPSWVDGTSVGGCSFMLHVRHAAAAIIGRAVLDGADHPWRERANPAIGLVRPTTQYRASYAGTVRSCPYGHQRTADASSPFPCCAT